MKYEYYLQEEKVTNVWLYEMPHVLQLSTDEWNIFIIDKRIEINNWLEKNVGQKFKSWRIFEYSKIIFKNKDDALKFKLVWYGQK